MKYYKNYYQMEYSTLKKRKTVSILEDLNLDSVYSIEINEVNIIKYISDKIAESNTGTKFILDLDNNLKIKDGYYSLNYNLNTIQIEVSQDMIKISNLNLTVLKEYIDNVQTELHRIRLIRPTIKYYIYYEKSWNFLEGSPKRSLSSIFINNKKKSELLSNIKIFLQEKELYLKLGIPYKYNILFYGLPGTGKTSFITAIASDINYDIAIMSSKNLDLTDETQIIIALSKLPQNCILLIEDVENISKSINITSLLDGINVKQGLITFMTSNIIDINNILTVNNNDQVNNPLVRPCRVDYSLDFTWAKKNEIIEMFNKFYNNLIRTLNSNLTNNLDNDFYQQVKHIKLTISLLQEFFFKYRSIEEVFLNIKELKVLSEKYYPQNSGYSYT
jgi:SpoVK/Ycf46/Vps4 family AAA+-type ATPase